VKYGVILSLLIALPSWSQTAKTGEAETTGPCSPAVTGSYNQFTINCQGITKRQGEDFLRILNKILKNELDPSEVLKRLDDIQKGIEEIRARTPPGYASLPDSTKEALVTRLTGRNYTVSARTQNPSPEVIDFATTLLNIFHYAGWNTIGPGVLNSPPAVGDEGVIPIPKGLHISARSERYELALFVQQQLRAVANIASHVEKDERVTSCDLDLFVGAPE